VGVAAGGFAASGYSPAPTFGPQLSVAVGTPSLRLALVGFYGVESRSSAGEQRAAFWVAGGALRPCLVHPTEAGWSARLCGVAEWSYVFSRGLRNRDGSTLDLYENSTPFVALGTLVGVGWPLTADLQLQVDGGLELPLAHHRFKFINANEDLHRFPWVTARAELTLERRF
jgi:hypothetical protein